jgi:putative membrane protein
MPLIAPADYSPLNAALNAVSTVFIAGGWLLIRAERKLAHIAFMGLAMLTSFVAVALYPLAHLSTRDLIRLADPAVVRPIYTALSVSHLLLAFTTVPLVVCTVIPALGARWMAHRRIARYTLPAWLYASVSGVLVYFMAPPHA